MSTHEKNIFRKLGNISKISKMDRAEPSARKQNFVNSDQNLPGSKYQSFVVLSF